MRIENVLFAGSTVISHPLLDHMFGAALTPSPEVTDPAGARLVIVDARLGDDALSENGIARRALDAGIAVLVIAPARAQLASLKIAGAIPLMPAQAVFLLPGNGGPRRCHAMILGYPLVPAPRTRKKGDQPAKSPMPTTGTTVLGDFAARVERGTARGLAASPTFPDGLKWSFDTWEYVQPLTMYTTGELNFTNGPGSLTFVCQFYSFLSVTPSSTSTYVVMQTQQTYYPGTLASNDDEGRGVLTLWFTSGFEPQPSQFVPTNHIPTNGVDSWNESFSIPISYLDPFGSYEIYDFNVTVAQSITSWSVKNASAGALQGSTWFVNSPVDGETFPEDRNDAFTSSGYVEPFPPGSTGTLAVSDASAWKCDGTYTGSLVFDIAEKVKGTSIYTTNCGAFFCYDPDSNESVLNVTGNFDITIAF